MAAAATGEPKLVFSYGEIIGRELRALGVNVNLAPVLDVNNRENPGIGVRSFGDSPETVIRYGREITKGLQSQYIFATAKHFPGMGFARLDTHFDFPVIEKPLQELESTDIAPFAAAVDAGIDCIMTSHAGFPAFTPDKQALPATFTPEIISDYIRNKLGFTGVVITDDLEMGAAVKNFSFTESILAALNAGADILCVCHSYDRQCEAIKTVVNGVKSGNIPEIRIDQSIHRIFTLKRKFETHRVKFLKEDIDTLVTEHNSRVEEIINKSITIFDQTEQLPLDLSPDKKILLVIPRLKDYTPVEELKSFLKQAEQSLLSETQKYHSNTGCVMYTLPPDKKTSAAALEEAVNSDVILFCSYNAHLDDKQSALLKSVLNREKPLILLMLRNPYDRFISTKLKTAVALHAPMHPIIRAGIRKIFTGS